MTKQDIKKNVRLSLEFDDYLAQHSEIYDKIPKGAVIVVTSGTDQEFRKASSDWTKRYPNKQTVVEARKYPTKWVLKSLAPSRVQFVL